MGTLTCRCGNVILNIIGDSPYSASLLPDKLQGRLQDAVLPKIHSLVEAIQQGQTISQWQGTVGSSQEAEEALLVYNLFTGSLFELRRDIYQCEECRRVLVQGPDGRFRTFLPEADDSDLVLDAVE